MFAAATRHENPAAFASASRSCRRRSYPVPWPRSSPCSTISARAASDVGLGKGTVYNEYEFVGHGLRSDDSESRMEEAVDIIERAWTGEASTTTGQVPQGEGACIRPSRCNRTRAVAQRDLTGSFTEWASSVSRS